MDDVIATLAEKMHEDWRAKKAAAGVTTRPDAVSGEELMVPYGQLSPAGQKLNLDPARLAVETLAELGYRIVKQ